MVTEQELKVLRSSVDGGSDSQQQSSVHSGSNKVSTVSVRTESLEPLCRSRRLSTVKG